MKHENESPVLSRTRQAAVGQMYLQSAHAASCKFQTLRCLVRKVLRITSLATPQMLAFCAGIARQVTSLGMESIKPFGRKPMKFEIYCKHLLEASMVV